MRRVWIAIALAACGKASDHSDPTRDQARAAPPPPPPPIDAAPPVDGPPDAPPDPPPSATPTQLTGLFPDRRPEIPPFLGIRFGEPIEEARRRLPPDYGRPSINVLDERGRVVQVFVEEVAATTDDLRALWGDEGALGNHWYDPERGVRAIATESAGGITIRIEPYQPLAPLLARLPLQPGIGARELAAALGGEQDPPEILLPPLETDDTYDSTSIWVGPHGYAVTLHGGHDMVHAALVARWGQPHVDELRGPEVFVTSPRVTAEWRDTTGVGGEWTVTVGTTDAAP